MQRFLLTFFAAVSLAAGLSATAWAASQCPEHFASGVAPTVTNPKLQARTQEICFEAFAVLHSGISRTPLYSAEYLLRANLEAAKTLSRKDSFHAESALPTRDRAELKDYARSGFDRGHMAPNADFATRSAQAESFSLANMVPQVHANNAGVWAGVENAVRQLATREGELYVITGPAFIGNNIQQIGRVLVPTHIWKVVYSPVQQRAGAYLITNDETSGYAAVTVTDLEKFVGIELLPGLSQQIRDAGMDLPRPNSARGKKSRSKEGQPAGAGTGVEEEFTLKDFSRSILDAIERAIK